VTRGRPRSQLHGEVGVLENLLEQFALDNTYGRTDTQATPRFIKTTGRIFGGETSARVVNQTTYGVTICGGKGGR